MTKEEYTQQNNDSSIIRVFIVRHGQTEYNVKKILQGHADIPLNENGHQQAELVGKRLKNIHFDCWISSDLDRCIQTTDGIKKMRDQIPKRFTKTQDFRERFMGEVQHMPIAEARLKYGDGFREKGEKRAELLARVEKAWERSLAECAKLGDKNVLLCTHGGVIRNFVNYLYKSKGYRLASGITEADLRLPYNTSITVVDILKNDITKGTIMEFGCTKHLGEQLEVADKDLR